MSDETTHANLTERILGLRMLGYTIPQTADILGVRIGVVQVERQRCRDLALDLIADALLAEATA